MLSKSELNGETLAAALAQSVDCVKLISLDGRIMWMNPNGICLMEIDDFAAYENAQWSDLWPAEGQPAILAGLTSAATGNVARFDAFCPTAKGTPKYWNVCISQVHDTHGDHCGYLGVSRDITDVTVARQAAEITTREMQHRIKNTYAMIGGLLMGYASGNAEHEQFSRDMQNRLVAISKAQTMFSDKKASCNIAELVPALVAPFDNARCTVTVGKVPAIRVDQGRADAIALVLGELAVNASKHGALAEGGAIRVEVRKENGGFGIYWDEQSTKAVAAKARLGGQGLKLIESIVTARGGTLDIAWQSHGPKVALTFPSV